MSNDSCAMIQQVVQAIGPDDPEDYRIQPTEFPELLAESAPELAGIAGHSSLKQCALRYEDRDRIAGDTQVLFKKLSSISSWSVFFATSAAALLASLTVVFPEEPDLIVRGVILLLGLCCFGGGSLATYMLFRINHEHLLENWMTSRAAAELERLGYFNRLVRRSVAANGTDSRLLLQCLEFVRRYQLTVQQVYYKQRGVAHRISRKKSVKIGALAAVVLGLGAGSVGIGASFLPVILPLTALGTIGAALSMIASRREELNQDGRNAERYQRTYEILSRLRELHSDVQTAVAAGESGVLLKYVDAIHEQLSLEHRQWSSDTEAMASTINALMASLKKPGGEADA